MVRKYTSYGILLHKPEYWTIVKVAKVKLTLLDNGVSKQEDEERFKLATFHKL